MNSKGLIIIMILFLMPLWYCERNGEIIKMHFIETACANPWSATNSAQDRIDNNDSDYLNKVKYYLEMHKIGIIDISITNDGPWSGCFSCFCSSGRRINISIYDADKIRALEIGFSE
jgi:hypothetical protein